jgi:N-acyl-L-homoserine lactone synthetase
MGKASHLAFDFVDGISTAGDMGALSELLLAAIEPWGFISFVMGALTRSAAGGRLGGPLCASPLSWYERYLREGYLHWDPVARHARSRVHPFLWSEVSWDRRGDPLGRRVMDEARRFGLENGLVVPMLSVGGGQNAVSLGGRPGALKPCHRQALHLICVYAHHRAQVLARADVPAWTRPSGASLDNEVFASLRSGAAPSGSVFLCRAPGSTPVQSDPVIPRLTFAAEHQPARFGGARVHRQPEIRVHAVTMENRHLYEAEIGQCAALFSRPAANQGPLVSVASHSSARNFRGAPIHLLAIQPTTRRLLGAIQLTPTVRPADDRHIGDLARIGRPAPRDPHVFHWCGYQVLASRCEGVVAGSVAGLLLAALQEYCLKENIEQLSTVVSAHSLAPLLELGWNPEPLGLPGSHDRAMLLALTLDISQQALARTRVLLGVPGPVVVRRSIRHSATPPVSVPRLH